MAPLPPRLDDATSKIAALTDAIKDASKDRLVIVLQSLLKQCNAAVPILERELLTEDFDSSDLESEDSEDYDEDDEEEEEERVTPEKSKKRARADSQLNPAGQPAQKRKLYQMCYQCNVEYNVHENYPEACQWHPGGLEADYQSDVWADHDENCHGRIDELEDEYPEGFVWSCCDKIGTEGGCEIGRHRYE